MAIFCDRDHGGASCIKRLTVVVPMELNITSEINDIVQVSFACITDATQDRVAYGEIKWRR
ncbi:hypothetical protein [Pasteuria penetrans]|uniref:hypothetical protein n=1 Tax=Pasteuria penetrans TaxID=86005 RepID=UPI0011EC99F0|nr:hypothetical protein [Pasteuria penetrans]